MASTYERGTLIAAINFCVRGPVTRCPSLAAIVYRTLTSVERMRARRVKKTSVLLAIASILAPKILLMSATDRLSA
jgi:hypothetical protein